MPMDHRNRCHPGGCRRRADRLRQQLKQGATAILAMADILAIGCFKQLLAHGYRVPEQVSLSASTTCRSSTTCRCA
jgi:DNA-binding LacI/PurR family transcriptional regulator